MPYFKWTGVDIVGDVKKGTLVAHSLQDLSQRLFQRGIAVLHSKKTYTLAFTKKINASIKARLFLSIAQLLKAGLLMPDVFILAADQLDNAVVYDALFELATDLKSGQPFAVALKKQQELCDPIVMTMLIVGHESGIFITAVENVADYYQMKHQFQKNMYRCVAMPLCTFLFFIGTALFIFMFIMPRFADMFLSINNQLPPLTHYMMAISLFVSSWGMLYCVMISLCVWYVIYYLCKKNHMKLWYQLSVKIPIVGKIIHYHALSQCLKALSLLLKSDISVLHALKIVRNSTHHYIIKHYIDLLCMHVESGMLLGSAMATMFVFSSDIIALVTVGENSRTLDIALDQAAHIYNDAMQQLLHRVFFLMQPLMIIILGVLIGLLILAVYLPIMNFSFAI